MKTQGSLSIVHYFNLHALLNTLLNTNGCRHLILTSVRVMLLNYTFQVVFANFHEVRAREKTITASFKTSLDIIFLIYEI